jgi:hypothetical protein
MMTNAPAMTEPPADTPPEPFGPFAAEDVPEVLSILARQVYDLTAVVHAMQEREAYYQRRRLATDAQRLAVLRQVTVPELIDRIRQGGA